MIIGKMEMKIKMIIMTTVVGCLVVGEVVALLKCWAVEGVVVTVRVPVGAVVVTVGVSLGEACLRFIHTQRRPLDAPTVFILHVQLRYGKNHLVRLVRAGVR
jgi:hypothetical protein